MAVLHNPSNVVITVQRKKNVIGLISNFKERVNIFLKRRNFGVGKNLKKMSFSSKSSFLKYKVLFNFMPFSVPSEGNLLL